MIYELKMFSNLVTLLFKTKRPYTLQNQNQNFIGSDIKHINANGQMAMSFTPNAPLSIKVLRYDFSAKKPVSQIASNSRRFYPFRFLSLPLFYLHISVGSRTQNLNVP